MDVSWSDWQVVRAALTEGTFSAAAESLGVGQATVSRRIAAVEEQLGHRLFDRHRTGLEPTAACRRLVPHLQALAAAADGAARSVEGLEVEARGEVRITAPPGLAADLIPALARDLRERHPDITLTVLADIQTRDLDRREADLALRMVPTTRGDLLVRRLLSVNGGLFAHPDYVATLPDAPEMRDVAVVQYGGEHAGIPIARLLDELGVRIALRSNDFLVQRAAIDAGLGAGLSSRLNATQRGWVPVPVALPELPPVHVYLVVHRALRQVPRVAVVIDAIDRLVADVASR